MPLLFTLETILQEETGMDSDHLGFHRVIWYPVKAGEGIVDTKTGVS
jgi:hypothetical protein